MKNSLPEGMTYEKIGESGFVIRDTKHPESTQADSKIIVGTSLKENIIKKYPSNAINLTGSVEKFLRGMKRKKDPLLKQLVYFKDVIYCPQSNNWAFYMKKYEGTSLRSYVLNKKAFPRIELCIFLYQMINTLEYLQEKKVILRALSTDHIIVENKLNIYPIFKIGGLEHLALEGDPEKPSEYTPSEENKRFINPTMKEINRSTDLYSLGVILFEMSTGATFVREKADMTQIKDFRSVIDECLGNKNTNEATTVRKIKELFESEIKKEEKKDILDRISALEREEEKEYENEDEEYINHNGVREISKTLTIDGKEKHLKFTQLNLEEKGVMTYCCESYYLKKIRSSYFGYFAEELAKIIVDEKRKHKNIVRYYSIWFDKIGRNWWILQEKPPQSLASIIKARAFNDRDEIVDFIMQMLEVLELMYKNDICLNALCPDHIYYEESTKTYLIDGLEFCTMKSKPSDIVSTFFEQYHGDDNNKKAPSSKKALVKTVLKMMHSEYFEKLPSFESDYTKIPIIVPVKFVNWIIYDLLNPETIAAFDISKRIEHSIEVFNKEYYLTKKVNDSICYAICNEGEVFIKKVQGANEISISKELYYKQYQKFVGSINSNGQTYIVCKKYNGVNLSDLIIKNEPKETRDYNQIAWTLINALNIMHTKGFIHRDIKSDNIMVSFLLKGKLIDAAIIDFGISIQQNSFNDKRCSKGYKPPEYLDEKIAKDNKVDIWGFGVVMLEVILKENIFKDCDKDIKEFEAAIVRLNGIKSKVDTKDFNLMEVIEKCLNINPEKRPTSREIMSHDVFSEMSIIRFADFDESFLENVPYERNIDTDFDETPQYRHAVNTWSLLSGSDYFLKLYLAYIKEDEKSKELVTCYEKPEKNLIQILTEEPSFVNESNILLIARDIAQALFEVHSSNCIHRCIRPEYIFVYKTKEGKYSHIKIGGMKYIKIDKGVQSLQRDRDDNYICALEIDHKEEIIKDLKETPKNKKFKEPILHRQIVLEKGTAKEIIEPTYAFLDIYSFGVLLYYLVFRKELGVKVDNKRENLDNGLIKFPVDYENHRTFGVLITIIKDCILFKGANRKSAKEIRDILNGNIE